MFLVTGVLKICSKFTKKHSSRSVISIKLQSNFIEITHRHGCSLVNLCHIFRKPFSKNTSGWLLLSLLDKSRSWRPSTLFKRFQSRYFPVYTSNFLKTLFYRRHLGEHIYTSEDIWKTFSALILSSIDFLKQLQSSNIQVKLNWTLL